MEYSYSFVLTIPNLAAAESIRAYLDDRDVFTMPLCVFRPAPRMELVVLKTLITKKGYRIELDVPAIDEGWEEAAPLVSQGLGIDLPVHRDS